MRLIMQPNNNDDSVPYLKYFYNLYANWFATEGSSNGKNIDIRNEFIFL
jgi:hypothetical protein